MHSDNVKHRKAMVDYLAAKDAGDSTNEIVENLGNEKITENGNLALVVKTYKFPNTFSQFMETSSQTSYKIEGPFVKD